MVGATDTGFANVTRGPHVAQGQFDSNEFVDQLRAVQFPQPAPQIIRRRELEDFTAIDHQFEGDIGMRQRAERDDVFDVGGFGRNGTKKLAACGQIEEQVAHFHDRSFRRAHVRDRQDFSARHLDLRPTQSAPFAAGQRESRDRGNAWNRFAAKPERGDALQVFGLGNLAGGVAFECHQRIVAAHAITVIGNIDERAPAVLDGDRDASGLGVQRVFGQLLHDRGGTFDHFAGGDLVGDLFGQKANPIHSRDYTGGWSC